MKLQAAFKLVDDRYEQKIGKKSDIDDIYFHLLVRARKEKVKREEVDRRVKESREEYSERFSPESQ